MIVFVNFFFFLFCIAAIAELLDNAVDEVCLRSEMLILSSVFFLGSLPLNCIVFGYVELLLPQTQNGATFVKIDKINIVKDNSPALVFQGTLPLNEFCDAFA